MYFYQRLRDLREDFDKTQKEIADYLGIVSTQYQRYESGKREIPYHMVISLSKLYNVSVDYISGITNEKTGLSKNSLDDAEILLVTNFRQLDSISKGRILERIDMMLKK